MSQSTTLYNFGHAVTTDGSNKPPPRISEDLIERTKVVPVEFAQAKVKEVATDLRDLRERYEKHVNQLIAYYSKCAEDSKEYYEKVFEDMKSKAMRHVELEQLARKESERKLEHDLKLKETTNEALRNTLSANNLCYQQASRKLKEKHADAMAELQESFDIRMCCAEALNGAVHKVADDEASALLQTRTDALRSEAATERREQQQLSAGRAECESVLRQLLWRLEASHQAEVDAELADELGRQQEELQRREAEVQLRLKEGQRDELVRAHSTAVLQELCAAVETAAVEDLNASLDVYKGRVRGVLAQKQREVDAGVQRGRDREEVVQALRALCGGVEMRGSDELSRAAAEAGRARHAADLEALRAENAENLRQLQAAHEDAMAALTRQYEENAAQLTAELTGKCASLEAQLRVAVEEAVGAVLWGLVDEVAAASETKKQSHTAAPEAVQMQRSGLPPDAASAAAAHDPASGGEYAQWGGGDEDEEPVAAAVTQAQAAPGSNPSVSAEEAAAMAAERSAWAEQKRALEGRIAELEESVRAAGAKAQQPLGAGTATAAPSATELLQAHRWLYQQCVQRGEVMEALGLPQEVMAPGGPDVLSGATPEALKSMHDALVANEAALSTRHHELQSTFLDASSPGAATFEAKSEEYREVARAKAEAKAALKAWMKEFEEAHDGRSPDNEERAEVKHLFVGHKEKAAAAKALQEELEGLMARKEAAEAEDGRIMTQTLPAAKNQLEKFEQFSGLAASTGTGTVLQAVGGMHRASPDTHSTSVADMPTLASAGTAAAVAEVAPVAAAAPVPAPEPEPAAAPKKDASEEALDALESQVYQLQVDLANAQAGNEALHADLDAAQEKLAAVLKEKRTDVVLRYEQDIAKLNASLSELNASLIEAKTEKAKSASKLKDMSERAQKAEDELKERDERAIRALDAKDEKVVLTKQVVKQREEIVMKSKAATAGWDAAADADERLEKAVDEAFEKGREQASKQHLLDMVSLNEAVEKKEGRITELVVELAEAQKSIKALEAAVEDAKAEAAQSGGAGLMSLFNAETGEIGVSNEELEAVREDLDAAQEEVVELTDRVDALQAQLGMAEDKVKLYQELVLELRSNSAAGGAGDSDGNAGTMSVRNATPQRGMTPSASVTAYGGAPTGGGGNAETNITTCSSSFKKAIGDGTTMWKNGKKDDCGELYYAKCKEAAAVLRCQELRGPLVAAIANADKVPRAKAAVALRKAMDKFLEERNKPAMRAAEEAACSAPAFSPAGVGTSGARDMSIGGVGAGGEGMSEAAVELQRRLAELNEMSASAASGGGGAGGIASSSSSGASGAESGNAGLLKRAKAAEAQVDALKKQLASLMASISDGSATVSSGGGGGGGGTAKTAKGSGAPGSPPAAAGRRGAGGAAGGGVGANPVEFKKLQKRVKELETALSQAQGEGGGGGASKKELAALEKKFAKQLKEQDMDIKKQTKAADAKVAKATQENTQLTSALAAVTTERDDLKKKVKEMQALLNEMGELRAKAEQLGEMKESLKAKDEEITRLAESYKKESTLRKKYKNELEDLKGAIRVYARCRPFAKYEIEKGCQGVVNFVDETSMKVATSRGEKFFEYDAVFPPHCSQEEIFEDTKRLVESCLDGFNVCVFAYGQTGSGKTHTMTGSPELPGLTPKAIDELFRLIEEKSHCVCHVSTYFVELYNDNLCDLYWVLDNKRSKEAPPKLDIKLDAKKMVFIRNSVIKEANSPDELMALFHAGNAERHVGATNMNAASSRSHSIFAVMVECYDKTTKKTTMGKLSLVDLAGSERADKTGAAAERLKEAQNINKSLSALGDVISALSEGEKFIPYRNNKLTQVMQDSLGGNAKTLMFVNFSPADYNCDETVTSLNYAARVKKITNNASRAAESEEVARLKATVKKLLAGQQVAAADLGDLAGDGGGGGGAADDNGAPSAEEAARLKERRRELTEGNGGGDEYDDDS